MPKSPGRITAEHQQRGVAEGGCPASARRGDAAAGTGWPGKSVIWSVPRICRASGTRRFVKHAGTVIKDHGKVAYVHDIATGCDAWWPKSILRIVDGPPPTPPPPPQTATPASAMGGSIAALFGREGGAA